MLKNLGWEGEGLGKGEKGIREPISAGETRAGSDRFKGVSGEHARIHVAHMPIDGVVD